MKNFSFERAESFEEAASMNTHHNRIIAGGTDLIGELKDAILEEHPEMLVDIKHIPNSNLIEVKDGSLRIGALATLAELSENAQVKKFAPAIAEAARSVATPLIRNVGTIGGNVCQDVRCWFYRYPHEIGGRMVCSRKGGNTCFACQGDSRYHSVYGGMKAHTTPCQSECPAGTDIPGYMEQLRQGNIKAAASIIMQVNPMPMLTSRVCAHLCQDSCNRCENDEHVAIGNVERYVGDYILENGNEFYTPPEKENGKSLAIVGAGPSGLSAAYYLRRAGNAVTVYDTKKEPGGMLMYAIPHYRLPKDLVRQFTGCLENMGIKFICSKKVGKDILPAEIEEKYDSIYYATGAWKRPVIGISGEELTEFGLDFLIQVNEWMKGKVGKEVLVTGGGNVAMDVAITAKRLGASKVVMACLESREEMPASREEIARAEEEGVIIMPSWGLSKVISEGKTVKGMELKRCISVRDESGAFIPKYDQNEKTIIEAENILMAVGQQVDLSFLDEKYQVQLTSRGLIDVSEETQATSREGVFAGGDATTGPSTVIQGIAAGHMAARGMCRYLNVDDGSPCNESKMTNHFLKFDPEGIQKKESHKLRELPTEERGIDKEDSFSLDADEALSEAGRCLNCGCYAVNPSDLAPVLIALDASIVTTQRTIKAEEFCTSALKVSDQLMPGEIVMGFDIPIVEGGDMQYDKFRLRDAVDFAIVSIASVLSTKDGCYEGARIVLGGVAPVPLRMREVEGYLIGKAVSGDTAAKAAELAVKDAVPFDKNAYKVEEIKALLRRALLRM